MAVQDEGAYLRVLAPRICRLSRAGLEAATGVAVRFPGELEVVMSSFTGVMELTEDDVVWRLAGEPVVTPPNRPRGRARPTPDSRRAGACPPSTS